MTGQVSLADILRTADKHIEPIDRETAREFIERIHYSRLLPNNVIYQFGLYEGKKLTGVVTYGLPASPSLCVGLAGAENRQRVLELNRLAIENGYGGENRASYLVSHSLKCLPNRTFVVSYADTGWTHIGYVYQACNFLYTGETVRRIEFYNPDGKHSRHYDKENTVHRIRNPKHRYVYLVGTKRDKREMKKELRYKVFSKYPKGDEVRYDTTNPQIAIPIQIVRK